MGESIFGVMDVEDVYTGVARALWVTSWASAEEEEGRTTARGLEDVMDVAPDTPEYAIRQAYRFVGMLEHANNVHIAVLLHRALEADLATDANAVFKTEGVDQYSEMFGHYMAMMGMGEGVGWWDDHAEFDIEVPPFEFEYFMIRGVGVDGNADEDEDEDEEDE